VLVVRVTSVRERDFGFQVSVESIESEWELHEVVSMHLVKGVEPKKP
jgi:hypothetical protein